MGRQLNRLSARAVASTKTHGYFCDGGGLYLQVAVSGSRTWIFRYRSPITGKRRDMGLGPVHSVDLAAARQKAAVQRSAVINGLDPIEERDAESRRKTLEVSKSLSFRQCATAYIESHKAGWRNQKHTEQWTSTLETYAGLVIGSLPVQDVDTSLVLSL